MYLLALFVLILAAAAITSGVIVCYNSYQNLQRHISVTNTSPTITQRSVIPIVTQNGDVISSPDQLEEHLQMLNIKLQEKVSALSENRSKACNTEEKIHKLDVTKNEIHKFYLRLKNEISRTENECLELQEQINDYVKRREEIKKEITDHFQNEHLVTAGASRLDDSLDETEMTYEEIQRWIDEFKNKYNLSLLNLETHDHELAEDTAYSCKVDDESQANYKSFLRVCDSINCDYKMTTSSNDIKWAKTGSKSSVTHEISAL